MRHLNTDSDSEVLLNILAHEIAKQKAINPTPEHLFKAVSKTHIRCDGAYAVVALITGAGILAKIPAPVIKATTAYAPSHLM